MATIQIDIKTQDEDRGIVICNLYTHNRCIQVLMNYGDYLSLKDDGFFIREGNEPDGAGVLNTTAVYTNQLVA